MFTILEKFIKAIILPLIMWYMTFGTALLRHFLMSSGQSFTSLNPRHPEFPGLQAWARSAFLFFIARSIVVIPWSPIVSVPGLPVTMAGHAAVAVGMPAIGIKPSGVALNAKTLVASPVNSGATDCNDNAACGARFGIPG